jgi:hypothetical protein
MVSSPQTDPGTDKQQATSFLPCQQAAPFNELATGVLGSWLDIQWTNHQPKHCSCFIAWTLLLLLLLHP